jgi:hypothetical protein
MAFGSDCRDCLPTLTTGDFRENCDNPCQSRAMVPGRELQNIRADQGLRNPRRGEAFGSDGCDCRSTLTTGHRTACAVPLTREDLRLGGFK